MFLIQEISKIPPSSIEAALTTLHNSSMVKRSAPNVRGGDVSTRLNLTDIAGEYLGKFSPPSGPLMTRVQGAMKRLRETTEMASVRTAIFKYEITAVRAETKDERICAVYLNQALLYTRSHKYDEAISSVDRVFTILPSYSEAYRISSFIAALQGDLYRAAEELDKALEHAPNSALIYYQYAQLALHKLDDASLALEKIETALTFDGSELTFRALRALALVRLGKCSEASGIYEDLLKDLKSIQRKWRILTQDQAAECYRRWAEQDIKVREGALAKKHLERSLAILEGAIALGDFDDRMGRLYVNVVEDGLFLAKNNGDTAYAKYLLKRYVDAMAAVAMPGLKRLSASLLARAFDNDPSITNLLDQLPEFPQGNFKPSGLNIVAAAGQLIVGRLKGAIPANQNFAFIRARGQDWFFHESDLLDPKEWVKLSENVRLGFEEGRDTKGRKKATRVRVIRHQRQH